MSRSILILALAGALLTPNAFAAGPSESLSNASRSLSSASGLVVTGSVQTLAASGQLVVASLAVTGETALLVLRGASEAGSASIQVSAELAQALAIGVGTVVSVVTEAAGYALVSGGKMLAYLPNEDTRGLLYQSRLSRP